MQHARQMPALPLVTIRCEGRRRDGRSCNARLGDIQAGAAYAFRCPICNTDASGTAGLS